MAIHRWKYYMVDKANITNMWKLLGLFNPEDATGVESLISLKDEILELIGLDATEQVRISQDELLALSFIYDRIRAVLDSINGSPPNIDSDLGRQAGEHALVEMDHELSMPDANDLAKRDAFLFRLWAISQIEYVLEQLGEEKPSQETL